MVDGKYSRSYIRTFFEKDGDDRSLSRSDAEAWLRNVGENPKNFDTFLGEMFKSGKTYSSATVFVKDAEKLVGTNFYDSNSKACGQLI